MKKAYRWQHPMNFVGTYPDSWAGYTFLQWSKLSNNWHEGVDYNGAGGCDADKGMPVFACANGILEWWGYHKGWGWHLYIKHKDPELGVLYSHYAHCNPDSLKAAVGEEVAVGQPIAEVGDSGWNFMCAHIHFEIRRPIGMGYDFWADPDLGWDKEKVAQYYFDAFTFIEERKLRKELPVECEERLKIQDDNIENLLDEVVEKKQSRDKWKRKYNEAQDKHTKELQEKDEFIKTLQDSQKEESVQKTDSTAIIKSLQADLKAKRSDLKELKEEFKTYKEASESDIESLKKSLGEKALTVEVQEEKIEEMREEVSKMSKKNGIKKWYMSKTIWVGVLEIIAGVAAWAAGELEIGGAITISGLFKVILRTATETKVIWDLPSRKK